MARSQMVAGPLLSLCAAGIVYSTSSAAPPDDETVLRTMIADLQSEIAELNARSGDQWLTERRAEEIRGLVSEVLADADTRASLLQDGLNAGWQSGKGFFIGSADGNYLLKLYGQLQVRAVYNTQDESPSDDNRFGFEMRRTKVFFGGHVFDPTWEYLVEMQFDRTGPAALGEDGWIQKNLENGWKVRAGQFKPYFLREERVSSRRLFNVERSLVNSQFTAGTSQGVQASYEADQWRAFASYHDGRNLPNTAWSVEDTEAALSGRFDWLALGDDWKATDDFNGWRGGGTSLLVGGGVHYQRAEFGTGSNLPPPDFNNAELENLSLTADASLKMDGFSAAAAIIYRQLETDTGTPADIDLDQIGLMVRAGFFLTDSLEAIVQYEWGDLDLAGIDDLSIVTVGVNKYFDKHNLKWQTDIGFALNEVAPAWASDSAGWRGDAPGQDGQVVVRSQFQLLF